jgi:hypothetical protein
MAVRIPQYLRPGALLGRLFDEDNRVATIYFIVALVVYLPGLFWGIPTATGAGRIRPWGTDELAPFGFGEVYLAVTGNLRNMDPRYPLFPYVVQAIFCGPYIAWLLITGQMAELNRAFPNGLSDPVTVVRNLTLLGRLPSLLMAAGVVAAACKMRPFAEARGDRRFDVFAGLLVLSITLMFYYSATSNVDMLALFCVVCALLVVSRSFADEFTVRRAILAGVFAALATASKDASYAIFVAVLPVVSVRHLWKGRAEGKSWPDVLMAPAVCVASGLLVYIVASGLVINTQRFGKHLWFITHGSWVSPYRKAYGSAPATLAASLDATWATVTALASTLGIVGVALVVLGLALSLKRDRLSLTFALPPLAVFVGVILQVRFVEDRFVLPMAYFLALFAAYAVWYFSKSDLRAVRAIVMVLLVVGMAEQVAKAGELEYRRLVDKRYALAGWFAEHVRPGDRVCVVDGPFKLPALEEGVVSLEVAPAGPFVERFLTTNRPEFFLVMPVHRGEVAHEHLIPDSVYEGLRDGSLGYTAVLDIPKTYLFDIGRFTYVDPPVTVFVRTDVRAGR